MSHGDDIHVLPVRYYVMNFVSLMVLLMITVWVSFYHFGDTINVAIMLSIAILKMTLVVLIFMHVWWSSKLVQVFAASGFLWLIIMFVLTFSDYISRDGATAIGVNRTTDAIFVMPEDEARAAEAAHSHEGDTAAE